MKRKGSFGSHLGRFHFTAKGTLGKDFEDKGMFWWGAWHKGGLGVGDRPGVGHRGHLEDNWKGQ